EQEVEVLLASGAALDAVHDLVEPARPLPARRALATRLVVEEARDPPRGPNGARGVVHDDDRSRAEHGPGLADLVLIQRHVDLVGAEPGCRRPTGDECLELAVVADAVAEPRVVEQIVEGGLRHLDLVVARSVHPARQREDARARRTTLTHGCECRPA